jgi:hypothetical protein
MPTLTWIGKEAVVNHHQQVPFHLLEEVPDLGAGDRDSGNLLVEGDNLPFRPLRGTLPHPHLLNKQAGLFACNASVESGIRLCGHTVEGESAAADAHAPVSRRPEAGDGGRLTACMQAGEVRPPGLAADFTERLPSPCFSTGREPPSRHRRLGFQRPSLCCSNRVWRRYCNCLLRPERRDATAPEVDELQHQGADEARGLGGAEDHSQRPGKPPRRCR